MRFRRARWACPLSFLAASAFLTSCGATSGVCATASCGESGVDAGASDGGPAAAADAGFIVASDAGALKVDAGTDAGSSGTADAGVFDPCPNLKIPKTCLNRTVTYREWSPSAVGDGTYFASQAPARLGFTRIKNEIWVVKFKTDSNSYVAGISAYGDNSGGVTWISDVPCAPEFAVDAGLVVYGNKGGGSLNFVVLRDAVDQQRFDT